jgi:hypothetical protein
MAIGRIIGPVKAVTSRQLAQRHLEVALGVPAYNYNVRKESKNNLKWIYWLGKQNWIYSLGKKNWLAGPVENG